MACDGDTLGIAVRDPYGSLKIDTLLERLDFCTNQNNSNKDFLAESYSKGLGLHLALNFSHHLIFNLLPDQSLEVISLIKGLKNNYKSYKSRDKELSLFIT